MENHLTYVNAQPSRRGVIKQTIGGSIARSWPPPLPRRHGCGVLLLLLLLGLSAAAAANNRRAVLASAVCVLAYVWSFLASVRGTACVVRYTTLLQPRLLRVLLRTAAAAAATAVCFAAAASVSTYCRHRCCCCCLLSWIFESRSPGSGK